MCLHKKLAKIHIYIHHKEISQPEVQLESDTIPVETPFPNNILDGYLQYLKKDKRIPVDYEKYFVPIHPMELIPPEVVCPICPNQPNLSSSIIQTRRGTIYDVESTSEGKNAENIQLSWFGG
jgi:hypothetical protein